MIGARRQIELTHCRSHQALTFGLELAKLPDLADAHVGIADDISGVGEALILYITGDLHALADGFASFAEFISAQFFVIDSRNFDVDVDAVK